MLNNGKVLVAAGANILTIASAELYDPATGQWIYTGSLTSPRKDHTATLLASGKVLVAGLAGLDFTSAELYDPATGTWTLTGHMNESRLFHSATLMPDGQVLVAGSYSDFASASAERYDPTTELWTLTGSLNQGRSGHVAILLATGEVLVAGGIAPGGSTLDSVEIYNSQTAPATKVTGHGTIDNEGNQVTFSISASQPSGSGVRGRFLFCDATAGVCATRARISSLSIHNTEADFSGAARLDDGTGVQFNASVSDNSSDGSLDTFTISLSNGYSASGTLTSGDISIQ
ncbi:MAG TPA: post-COAP-1 domain-containing protein [Chthoniobacterales bacterium]